MRSPVSATDIKTMSPANPVGCPAFIVTLDAAMVSIRRGFHARGSPPDVDLAFTKSIVQEKTPPSPRRALGAA